MAIGGTALNIRFFSCCQKPKDVGGSGMPLELAVELHKKYFNAELNKEYKIVAPAYSGLEGFKVSHHATSPL